MPYKLTTALNVVAFPLLQLIVEVEHPPIVDYKFTYSDAITLTTQFLMKGYSLMAEEPKKTPTIEELQTQIAELKKTKEEEIVLLKAQLDEEKRKNAQYILASMGAKPQEEKPEEKIEFDFKY